jgi:hypothetical protein
MIISHEHKFVFVQVPQTGSSFIGNYLINHFAGKSVLDKHSVYTEFLDTATQKEQSYWSIVGKRNPLDRATTRFARHLNKSGIRPTSIREIQTLFEDWFWERFIKRNKRISDPHLRESHPFVDYMIGQENLEQDLARVLNELGLEVARIPKWRKRTKNKLDHYSQYYSDALIPLALETFRDEMSMLNYEIPAWCSRRLNLESSIQDLVGRTQ